MAIAAEILENIERGHNYASDLITTDLNRAKKRAGKFSFRNETSLLLQLLLALECRVYINKINNDEVSDYLNDVLLGIIGVIVIIKQNQTITFPALPTGKSVGDADFSPGATASSGLTISYLSNNESVLTIVNGQIHIIGVGSATVTANQEGSINYNPAAPVSRSISIAAAKLNQTITFPNLPSDKKVGDADFGPGATASSGLSVSYASNNTAVATIIGGQIHIVGVGNATITATQAGNATYNAATPVQRSISIGAAPTFTLKYGYATSVPDPVTFQYQFTAQVMPGFAMVDLDFGNAVLSSDKHIIISYPSNEATMAFYRNTNLNKGPIPDAAMKAVITVGSDKVITSRGIFLFENTSLRLATYEL